MNGQNDKNINPEVLAPTQVAKLPGSTINVDTPSGAAWVRKYLHPPCATPADYAGYPDANNSPSTDAEYKGLNDIQTFVTVAGPPVSTIYYNRVLLLHTASAIAPVIPFKMDTTGSVAQIGSDVILNRNINVTDMVNQNASGRLTYKSTTSWLNATGFNNQGNVTSAQFRPNVLRMTAAALLALADQVHAKRPASRLAIYSDLVKFYHRANSEYEILDYPPSSIEACIQKHRAALAADIDNVVQVLQVGNIPFDPSEILMMSPNSVAASAKEGSFVVQRFSQPEVMYKDFPANGVSAGSSNPLGMPCFIYEPVSPTTGTLAAIAVAGQPGNSTSILADLPWFDFLWGWTLYEGLSVTSSGSTAGVTPPYVSVKTITGFEFQPLPDSMLSPFIRNCAIYDMSALRFATTTNHAIADSLPAAANFWGTIGKVLLQAAPTIIDTVSSLFGSKRSTESKKLTNDTVKMLTDKISSMETKLSAKPQKNRTAPAQQQAKQLKVPSGPRKRLTPSKPKKAVKKAPSAAMRVKNTWTN
jgi:hypothetical protein